MNACGRFWVSIIFIGGMVGLSMAASGPSLTSDWLAQNVPSTALQQLDKHSNEELALLQSSRYRLPSEQLSAVSQQFKNTFNKERVLIAWQKALVEQAGTGKAVDPNAPNQPSFLNNPLYVELEKRIRETNWTSADFQNYQKKLHNSTPNAKRYALMQAIVVARGALELEVNLAVAIRKQLLMIVAKTVKNWSTNETQINQMLSTYQKKQLDANTPVHMNRLMYAFRFTSTQQLQDYVQLLESDAYQSALTAWSHALDVSLVGG